MRRSGPPSFSTQFVSDHSMVGRLTDHRFPVQGYGSRARYCLRWVWLVALGAMTSTIFVPLERWDVPETICILIQPAMIGGVIALAIIGYITGRSNRPLATGDVVRTLSWTCIGVGFGVFACADYAESQHVHRAYIMAQRLMAGGLFTIMVSWLVLPPLPATHDGCCRQCGYSLKGLPEPRCPECGTPFGQDECNGGE